MTEYANRRKYKDEPYLRAEHLFKHGKYLNAVLTISDVIYDCPGKKMGAAKGESGTKSMIGVSFEGQNKVLGLNVTNEALVCWVTGEGDPQDWKGKKIHLVVRLIENRKEKILEPAIRVWPGKFPHPNKRVREQMGIPVDEKWYKENPHPTDDPDKPVANPDLTAEERKHWLDLMTQAIADVNDRKSLANVRVRFTNLGAKLEEKKHPLTSEERTALADALSAVAKTVAELPESPEDGALL